MKAAALLACIAAVATMAPSVDAHGYMMVPKQQLASGDPTRYFKDIRGTTILTPPTGGSFSNTPQVNLDSFTKAFKASSYKSLRDIVDQKVDTGCGLTPAGGPAQPVPDAVEWSSFVESHVGPCEVWCDNTRVYQNDNCATIKSSPAKLPIDKSKCSGAKQLRFLWLALHSQDWQFYISCAPLSGASSGGSSGGSAPKPAPAPAPQTQRPATQAPSPVVRPTPAPPANNNGGNTGGDADCDDDLPEPDCDEYPEPGDDEAAGEAEDCDDLPEPDCDDDLPEPDCDDELRVAGDDDEYGGEADNIGFDALQRGPKYSPGKAVPETGY